MDFTGLLLDFYWTSNILISFEYPLIICTPLNRRFSDTLEESQKKKKHTHPLQHYIVWVSCELVEAGSTCKMARR